MGLDIFKGTINDGSKAAAEIVKEVQDNVQTDLASIEALVRRLIEGYTIIIQAVPKVKK